MARPFRKTRNAFFKLIVIYVFIVLFFKLKTDTGFKYDQLNMMGFPWNIFLGLSHPLI